MNKRNMRKRDVTKVIAGGMIAIAGVLSWLLFSAGFMNVYM
jgi:hypothetical protein